MSHFFSSEPAQIGLRTAFSLLVTTNLFGNSLVCLVVFKNRSMRSPMNYLLVNLACADMMLAIFMAPQYIFLHTYEHPQGTAGDYVCKFLTGESLASTGGVVSVMSLVVTAFERYYAVLYPRDVKRRISNRKLKFIIPACWLFSFLWNLPGSLVKQYSEEIKFCYEKWPEGWYMNAYRLGWLIVIGILPLSIMAGLYSRVVFNLWFRAPDRLNPSQSTVVKSRKRVTKIVLTVTVVCAVCWLPVLIVYVLVFYGLTSFGDIVTTSTVALVTVNSTVNPFIYCFQSKTFRRCVKALLFSRCSMRRPRVAIEAPRHSANVQGTETWPDVKSNPTHTPHKISEV